MKEIKDRLRQIFLKALRLHRTAESIPDQNLTAELGLASINSLEVLIWVENEFGIQIDDEDLSVALIDSMDVLAAYVENKLLAKNAATVKSEVANVPVALFSTVQPTESMVRRQPVLSSRRGSCRPSS
jgi:acyl carrier protein